MSEAIPLSSRSAGHRQSERSAADHGTVEKVASLLFLCPTIHSAIDKLAIAMSAALKRGIICDVLYEQDESRGYLEDSFPQLAERVRFVGTGPLAGTLARQAGALGLGERVHWHGFCQNAEDYLAHCDALLMQLPIGSGATFLGMVDLVDQRAVYFDGDNGQHVRTESIPADMVDQVRKARNRLLEALAMYSDPLLELLLAEQEVPAALIHDVVKQAVCQRLLTPVFLGSAYRNKGVQPLLDAVLRYLPSPQEAEVLALKPKDSENRLWN